MTRLKPGKFRSLATSSFGERLELLRVDAADVDRRLVRRVRRHREHGAVARVERDDRAAVRVPFLVLVGKVDPVLERPLRRPLEADVEREADVVPRLGRPPLDHVAHDAPERVDAELRRARLAAQVGVERRLDARLADLLACPVALLLQPGELVLRDLADVAEHLRRERAVLVVAQVGADDRDAAELVRALLQRRHLLLVHGRLDEDRRQRVVPALLERLRQLRQRHAQHLREPLQHRVAALLGQIGHSNLDRRAGHVRDDRVPGPVEDRAARGLDGDGAELVVLRRVQVAVAGEDLERPQAQEEDGEDDERERGQHADPERELGREPVRLRTRAGRAAGSAREGERGSR